MPTQEEPRQQPHRHKRRWRCQMQMRAGHNACGIQSGFGCGCGFGWGWECGRTSFLRTRRQSFTCTTFLVLPASSGLGVFRFDLCRATFDLVVILGVIPVVAGPPSWSSHMDAGSTVVCLHPAFFGALAHGHSSTDPTCGGGNGPTIDDAGPESRACTCGGGGLEWLHA